MPSLRFVNRTKRIRRKPAPKKINEKVKWVVTVQGYNNYYTPAYEITTVTISLKRGRTPIDWLSSKPRVYSRFEFGPIMDLINFWKV